MAIKIKQSELDDIKRHGEATYPHECCGFLIGTSEEGLNILHQTLPADNEWPDQPHPSSPGSSAQLAGDAPAKTESQRNRYLITPEQWKRADAHARSQRLAIIGYYHSHPDRPAAPSGFDLDHSCWPGESYIIVSIQEGRAADINSFAKPDYTHFEKEPLLVEE
ncbi:MAG TPA: M67 family metallopeptidase [Blastocatellia bacterium]